MEGGQRVGERTWIGDGGDRSKDRESVRKESHGNHGNTDTLYLLGANRWCRVPRLLGHLLIAIGE